MLFLSKYLYQLILLTIFIYPLVLQSDSFIEEQKRGWESAGNEILIDASPERLHKVFLRYGNWTGPGLSGGLEDPIKIGLKPPVDSLDEASMRHDFAYLIAQKQGAIYGADEEERLKSLADKILLKELRTLPKDPRKWKHPPKGSVDYKAVTDFKDRMITIFTLTEKGQKYITSPYEKAKRIQIDSKKDGTMTTIYKELITDQKQKLTESDLQRHVKTLTKDWKNHADFTNEIKDSDLTKAQEKELYKIYRKDPQEFQKNYTSYKNRHAVPKSKAQIQQDKRTAAVAKKYNVYPEDLKKFLNCVCRDSGGTLGGHYDPKNGSPCIADGALNSWPSGIKASKSHTLSCRNWLDAEQYKKDMKIFDEMRASDAQIAKKREQYEEKEYQKLLKIIQAENAKAFEDDVREVKQLMQKNETLLEASQLFDRIKDFLYKKDKNTLSGDLWSKLLHKAAIDKEYGNLKGAIYSETSANSVRDHDPEKDPILSAYKRWEKSWSEARSKLFPQIDNNTSRGNLISAKQLLKNLSRDMTPQMGYNNKLPYAYKDPKYIAMKERVHEKEKEYSKTLNDSYQKIAKYKKERDPRSALKLTKKLLDDWQHESQRSADLRRNVAAYKKLIKLAEQNFDTAEMYKKQKNYSNAIKHYRASLSYQKDSSIQRKLDELLKRHKVAISLQKDGDAQLKKDNIPKAISQYERSVKYWPNSDLQNLINRLKQRLEQEKRKAELEAKIAKLEREKARQEEEAMTSAGLDFGNRFGSRESRRTEQVQEKQNRDVYAGNSERADDQEEMLKRLKQGLEKMKSIDKVSIKPVHTASIPPKTAGSSSHIPTATSQPSDSSSTSTNKKFNTHNISAVSNNPKKPTLFIFKSQCKLISITNYHWNNAKGSNPGTIGVRSQSGKNFGPWNTSGKPGQGGVPNAYWTANPNVTLPAGTYTVIDSEPSTWAQNAGSGYRGMSNIKSDCSVYEPDSKASSIAKTTPASTQATKPVSKPNKPAKSTSISTTGWDGLYTGTYTDKHLNTRDARCQNHSGKLSVVVKGNRFSGDGSGTITQKGSRGNGYLHGTFKNGFKTQGSSYLVFNNTITGFISGPKYCTAAIDLRKDKTGKKTYTPAKVTKAPKATPKWVLINTIIYTEPKNSSSYYDTSLQLKNGSFKYKIAPKDNLNYAFSVEGVWHGVPRVMVPNQNYNIDVSIKRLRTTNYAFDTYIQLAMDSYDIGCGAKSSSKVSLSKGDTKVGWRESDQTSKSWRGSFKAPEFGVHGSRSSKKIQIKANTAGGCVRYIYEWKE